MTTHHPATNTADKNNGGQDVKIFTLLNGK
jgi:hypothetical protein